MKFLNYLYVGYKLITFAKRIKRRKETSGKTFKWWGCLDRRSRMESKSCSKSMRALWPILSIWNQRPTFSKYKFNYGDWYTAFSKNSHCQTKTKRAKSYKFWDCSHVNSRNIQFTRELFSLIIQISAWQCFVTCCNFKDHLHGLYLTPLWKELELRSK